MSDGVMDMAAYYYRRLNKPEQAFYRNTVDAIRKGNKSVTAGIGLRVNQVEKVVTAIAYDRPELFYVDFRQTNTVTAGGFVTYQIRYYYPDHMLRTRIDQMDQYIADFMAEVGEIAKAPPLEKVKWIHDTVVKSVRYDDAAAAQGFSVPDAHTIVGVFEKKTAVCEGIAKAVTLLGDRLGIELPFVFGDATNGGLNQSGPHAWNLVRIDGVYAHLDVTWDNCFSVTSRSTRYDYFCVSDTCIRRDHHFTDIPASPDNTGMSFFEKAGSHLRNYSELNGFLDTKLREKRKMLYFRLATSGPLEEAQICRIDDLVMKKVAMHRLFGAQLAMMHNTDQGIFFYRIYSIMEKRW